MNYIQQLNAFWDRVEDLQDLKPSAINVYLALLHINNKTGWKQKFRVTFGQVLNLTGISNIKTYYSATQDLNQKGYIIWIKAANQYQAATFELPMLYQISEEQRNSTGNILKQVNKGTIKPLKIDDDVDETRAAQIEQAIADFTGPDEPTEEKEKSSAQKEKKVLPTYLEVLQEEKLVNTETWRNAKEHYGIDDSTREAMFKIFYEQNLDRYAILYPTYQAMAQHFYNWVPVHQQKQNIQRLKQLTNGAKTTNPQYPGARTGRHAAMAGLDDLAAKSAEFLRKSAGQDYYGDLANEQL